MAQMHVVNVRTLAEFACMSGSLRPGASLSRMREGREGHAAIQDILGPAWQAEVPVSYDMEIEGIQLRIQGRADAFCQNGNQIRIAEIKTTRRDLKTISSDDYPAHWVQAEIYAWLLGIQMQSDSAEYALIYANPRSGKRRFSREMDFDALNRRCLGYIRPYAQWLRAGDEWKESAEPTQLNLKFPFDNYRDGQREMAKYVYSAMAHQDRTLIEAPTGIGKTAASLFGAMKALGEGKITSVF